MMLKGLQAAGSQAKSAAGAPARLNSFVNSVSARRRHAAFKSGRQTSVRVAATAEAENPAPVAAAATSRTPTREVTVDLAQVKAGDVFEGVVTGIEGYGAFVNFGAEKEGLVHISQLSNKYVSSIAETVKVNDAVTVRVLSIDAASGKIALTMKTEAAAGGAAADGMGFEEEDDMAADDDADMQPADGHEFVYADSTADFEFPFQMEQEDGEMSINVVNDFEDGDMAYERVMDLAVPLNELVTGKVNRVEDFGAFVTIAYGNQEFKAFLERDEAKIPASALSAEELAEYGEDGEITQEYIDAEFDDMRAYYKVGDQVSAFVLDYTDRGELNLTQFTDVEVEADGFELEEDEFEETDKEPLSMMGSSTVDVLAMDPEDLLEEEEAGGSKEADREEADTNEAVSEYKVYGRRGPLSGALFTNGDMAMPAVNFPDRPMDKVDSYAINSLSIADRDFDGDEIYLEDLWQESIPVPKDVLKRLNLKIQFDEKGESEVVDREGEAVQDEEDVMVSLSGDHAARVAAFVSDLLDEDEDEAEVPALAMRRPVVMAISVENISAKTVKALRDKTGAGMMDCKKALGECDGDEEKAIEWLRQKGLSGADKKSGRVAAEGAIVQYIHPGARLGCLVEVNCETDFVAAGDKFQSLVNELGMIIAASPDVMVVSPEDVDPAVLAKEREVEMGKEDIKSKPEAVRAKIVEGRIEKMKNAVALVNQASLRDPNKTVAEIVKETIAAVGENVQIRRFVKYQLGEGIQKKSNDFAAEVAQQTQAKAPAPKKEEPKKEEAPKEAKPDIVIPAAVVKELRNQTGAGMMDCKKALAENNLDIEASVEWLRKKGLSGADKKSGRVAAEGAIVQYIHPGARLGVLLEVNCETDFVAAGDPFNNLANGIAMQIAASPQVQYVSAEDIPAEVFEREKLIEMGREDLQNKPEAIRAKIAEGRVAKLAQEMALLPQPYLMDPSKTVEQAVKEAIAAIGEKISIRRFVKYQLGEGIEKKVMDLAADVAAMTKSS